MSQFGDITGAFVELADGPADALMVSHAIAASAQPSPTSLLNLAKFVLAARVRRQRHFPKTLFRETAWDMMLELFICSQEKRSVCVKQLVAVSGQPSTNAMRKIDQLQESELVARMPDTQDHRRVEVRLTERGNRAMLAFLEDLAR